MKRTRVKVAENTFPAFSLIFFDLNGTTGIKRTDQLKWIQRGKSCRFWVGRKDIDGKILAMKGIFSFHIFQFQVYLLKISDF